MCPILNLIYLSLTIVNFLNLDQNMSRLSPIPQMRGTRDLFTSTSLDARNPPNPTNADLN
jgi:hypothetical protein